MRDVSLTVRTIWAACLLIAGANHARILVQHGLLWDYGGVHWMSAVYWSSLTLIDPLVALLLFVRPRLGVIATIVLIVTNVVHNLSVYAQFAPGRSLLALATMNGSIMSQVGFMLFVIATACAAWAGIGRNGHHGGR